MEKREDGSVFDAEVLKQLIEGLKDGEMVTIYPISDSDMDEKRGKNV